MVKLISSLLSLAALAAFAPNGIDAAGASSIDYELEANNKRCKNPIWTGSVPSANKEDECFARCASLQECTGFSLTNSGQCKLCNQKFEIEYKSSRTLYKIKDRDDDPPFTRVHAKVKCSDDWLVTNEYTVASQEECFTACDGNSDCMTFSVSDRAFSPIGGGTCRLCSKDIYFVDDNSYTTYWPTDPSSYQVDLPYLSPVKNKRCKSNTKIFEETVGTVLECHHKCDSIQGCSAFSVDDDKCWGCRSSTSDIEYKSGWNTYALEEEQDWKFTKLYRQQACPDFGKIGEPFAATQEECYNACKADTNCLTFSIDDLDFNPIGGGAKCQKCSAEYDFDESNAVNKHTVYSPITPAEWEAQIPYALDENNKRCKNEIFDETASTELECHDMCYSTQGCSFFSFKLGDDKCYGCKEGDSMEYKSGWKSYVLKEVQDWKFTKLYRRQACPDFGKIGEPFAATQEECYSACKADTNCVTFSIDDLAFSPIGGGAACQKCSAEYDFDESNAVKGHTVYSPMTPAEWEAQIPYEEQLVNKRCKSGVSLFNTVASTELECHDMCYSTQGCSFFSFKKGDDNCWGCKDASQLEYKSGWRLYKLDEEKDWQYKKMFAEESCQDNAVLGTFTDLTQDECHGKCLADEACVSFSINDLAFSPIGGGSTCKTCSRMYGFEDGNSAETSTVYSRLTPTEWDAQIPYKEELTNKRCKDEIFSESAFTKLHCNDLCNSVQGCDTFSFNGSTCRGCKANASLEYKSGWKHYSLEKKDWQFTKLFRERAIPLSATIGTPAVKTQEECHSACLALGDQCKSFSVRDMEWPGGFGIGIGECRLSSLEYGFEKSGDTEDHTVYSPLDPVAYAATIPYTANTSFNNKRCKGDSRVFTSDGTSSYLECSLKCYSMQGCNFFSMKSENCYGCSDTNSMEYKSGWKSFDLTSTQTWKFTRVNRKRTCSGDLSMAEFAGITTRECYRKCIDTDGCGFFSMNDLEFSPTIGSGTCNLCKGSGGFESESNSNTYSIVSPENFKPVCEGLTGVVWGDPHLITYDKLKYDCQGRGEYVLAMTKQSDPLQIHGRFVDTGGSATGPSVMRSIAIVVDPTVPVLQVTIPDMPVDGKCPFTFTEGLEEYPIQSADVSSYMTEEYAGKANAFVKSDKSVVITYPDKQARIELIVKHSRSERFGCRMRANICLTPENHGGAANFVGLLGTPSDTTSDDWMSSAAGNTPISLPSNPKKAGTEYCNSNWCVADHDSGSLYSSETFEKYNQCLTSNFDAEAYDKALQEMLEFFQQTAPEAIQACDASEDPDSCKEDLVNAVNGTNINPSDIVQEMQDEEEESQQLASTSAAEIYTQEGWSAPDPETQAIISTASSDMTSGIVPQITLQVPEESSDPSCPVCMATGWGDPHIVTFDGVQYDVHVRGELTFLKSLDTDFTIQARTEIVENHPKGPAVTTGVVVHEDSTKTFTDSNGVEKPLPDVQVSLGNSVDSENARVIGRCPVQLFVNGISRDISTGTGTEGANIQVQGRRIVLEYPSTNLRLDMRVKIWRDTCHFSVRYVLVDCRCDETLVGILGQPDNPKNWTNDWHEHDGTPVEIPRKRRDRVTKKAYDYSLTWCLLNETMSHFTYESDQLGFDYFDGCSPDNYDDTLDTAIENASPETIEKCTVDGTLDDACVIECEYLEPGACDEYKEEITLHTQTAEIEIGGEPEVVPTSGPTSAPTSGPTSAPTSGPTSGPTKQPTPQEPVFDDAGENGENNNSTETSDTSTEPTENSNSSSTTADTGTAPIGTGDEPAVSGSQGDPHFKQWNGDHFEFHGQCDLLLAKVEDFAGGIGLNVQIRTKLVRYWSYISSAAIRIGDEILEVRGTADVDQNDPIFWLNFDYRGQRHGDITSIGGFPLKISKGVTFRHKHRFEIDLSSKFPGQKIILATMKEFVKVEFQNASADAYGNAVGMLGDFETSTLLARDGKTVIDDYIKLGEEWQLLPTDEMLFHDVENPQFPKRCILPEDPQGQRRRRLDEGSISLEQAEDACSHLRDPLDVKDCVYDILATQDLDMAGAF